LADSLAVEVCKATSGFPRSEVFGLGAQMRRAAVSTVSNIVEGAARDTLADYTRFLDVAYGSSCELEYQVSLAQRLGLLSGNSYDTLQSASSETARVLNGLVCSLRRKSKKTPE